MIGLALAIMAAGLAPVALTIDLTLGGPSRRREARAKREEAFTFGDVKAAPVIDALRIGEMYQRHRAEAIESLQSVSA